MGEARRRAGGPAAVAYDGDQKLLAFFGAVGFVVAVLFWGLLALRLAVEGAPSALSWAAAGLAAASASMFVPAWGLRAKMEHGFAVTRGQLRGLLAAGLLLGVAVGGLAYFVLRFKLEDPEFLHLASVPENLPPALR